MNSRRSRLYSSLRVVFVLAGLGFLAYGFWHTWSTRGTVFPRPGSIALATALLLVRLYFSPRTWTALFEDAAVHGPLIRGYYVSLLGRYIPGGIWQAVGQLEAARDLGIPRLHGTSSLIVQAMVQAIAGAAVGSLVGIFGTTLSTGFRAAALAGCASVLLLHRGWMVAVATRLAHWTGRDREGELWVPSQAAIYRSFGWSIPTLLTSAIAFAVLVESLAPATSAWLAIAAFCLAWTVGFVVVVIPAGAGIREAVLLLALAPAGTVVIVASVFHRLAAMATEVLVLLFLVAGDRRRRASTSAASAHSLGDNHS